MIHHVKTLGYRHELNPFLPNSSMTFAASATDRNQRSSFATTTTAYVFRAAQSSLAPAALRSSGLPPDTPASSYTSTSSSPLSVQYG